MSAAATPARWVLLRGLLREVGHWGGFVDQLRSRLAAVDDRAPDVLAMDLPGCGALHHRVAPSRVGDLLSFARGESGGPRAADGPKRWLLGLSLGGMVVSAWVQRHPGDLAGAVIISSSAADLSPPWARMRPGGAWHLVRAALARTLEARERHVWQATTGFALGGDEVVARWVELGREHPVSAANAARLLLAADRFRLTERGGKRPGPADQSAPVPVPVLVLAGAGDRLVHPSCSRALARALGAELQIHPRAGHDLPLEDPEWVLEAVEGWLRRQSEGNRPSP